MKAVLLGVVMLLLAGCEHDHEHAGNGGHDHASHDHGHHESGHGHDDHGHGHEEHEGMTIVVTHFTEDTELFVEFPALVVGEESSFVAHLTRLDTYQPIAAGDVTLTLSGGGAEDEVFSVSYASTPGIFRPMAIPKHAVTREISLRYQGAGLDVLHRLGTHAVYSSKAEAVASMSSQDEPSDSISYLKEQQWQVDFAVSQATVDKARASVQATGTLRPRADAEVFLSASSAGHLRAKGGFPYPGMVVEPGQIMATLAPRFGTGGDLSTLKATRVKATSKYLLARHERERLAILWKEEVISEHRLHIAQTEEEVAKAAMDSAERRYRQSTGHQQVGSGIPILAPIGGGVAQVNVASGQFVQEGDALFHIINTERLWLEARIAEADIGALQNPNGAWFTLKGFEGSFSTFELDGRVVVSGGVIDPVSRTSPLIFEFKNPGQRLRSGMFANVRVYTGEVDEGVMIPASAVFNDGGQEVVYVMLEGESFQRRIVRLGIRDGDRVQVRSGVAAGEWVVSEGAYMLRLASAATGEIGHGHAH